MAITKWTRQSGRKLLTAKAASKRFSRKHMDWVLPFDVVCLKLCLAPNEVTCPSGFALNLMSNAQLTTAFDGSTRIAKIRGRLYFQAIQTLTGNPCNAIQDAVRSTYLRLGLKKVQGVYGQGPFVPDGINPLIGSIVTDPTTLYGRGDYTEQKWLKLWEHNFQPYASIGAGAPQPSCCPVVSQASYVVPPWEMAVGSGEWPGVTVPALSTDCIPCDTGEEQCLTTAIAQLAPVWSVGINYSRPIAMTGSDVLNLWGGFETLGECYDFGVRPPQATLAVWGSIKMLVERG